MQHRGWYTRHERVPHLDQPGLFQAITLRLADSLPAEARERVADGDRVTAAKARERLHALLDAGHGACALRDPRAAQLVEDALLYHDEQRYRLLAWVVMPNHVHVLVETLPGVTLDRIVATWKSYSARRINALLGRSGPLWQSDYYDRAVRGEGRLGLAVAYVHNNPVVAGLVERAQGWPWSSARRVDAARCHIPRAV